MGERASEVSRTLWIRGGRDAPARARADVLSQLDGEGWNLPRSDVALIVSELVTNSVIHANVGHDQALCLQLTPLGDRLRIAVTDPGSELEPGLLPHDPAAPGGFGLRVVDQVSSAWGIVREVSGATRVWCDVPLGGGAAL
jgi:anti-sigma regulatory factor (Ser/Thr protein kinase)